MELFAQQGSEANLPSIRPLIGEYFAQRLTGLADKEYAAHAARVFAGRLGLLLHEPLPVL